MRDARLRAAQALTGLAWWELDPATGRHEWSEEMFALVGLERADEPPSVEEYLALIHPEDRAAASLLSDSGFGTGHREVFRVVRPDGEIRHLQSWTDVDRDASGAVVRVVGATIDVTEREQLLASVAQSRASLAAALELTRTATWEWDVAADRLTWSDRMFALMGIDTDVAPSLADFLAAVHPEDRASDHQPERQHRRHRTVGGGAVPGRPRRRVGAPHPRLDGRTPGTRRLRQPPVGHGDGRHRAGGVGRPADRQRGALPGRLRERADRHDDDQPRPRGPWPVPARERRLRVDGRPHQRRAGRDADRRADPPRGPRARRRQVRPAGARREPDGGVREALRAQGRQRRARLDHEHRGARRGRASRSTSSPTRWTSASGCASRPSSSGSRSPTP